MPQPAIDFDELPKDPISRREQLELRTVPNPGKPCVGKAREAKLAGLEEKTAQCYVAIEESTYRLRQLAQRIGDTVPTRATSRSESEEHAHARPNLFPRASSDG